MTNVQVGGAVGTPGSGRTPDEAALRPTGADTINPQPTYPMSKSQDSKKQTKKAPLKTPAEKRAAKLAKKAR